MPVSPRAWLVSYDITDPRRLARVARLMERHGIRLQYSVFVVLMDRAELDALCGQLDSLIRASDDDIRIYPIAARGRCDLQGDLLVPAGMLPHHEAFRQLRLPLHEASPRAR